MLVAHSIGQFSHTCVRKSRIIAGHGLNVALLTNCKVKYMKMRIWRVLGRTDKAEGKIETDREGEIGRRRELL